VAALQQWVHAYTIVHQAALPRHEQKAPHYKRVGGEMLANERHCSAAQTGIEREGANVSEVGGKKGD
jgi:hypothetical protein